ncbi:hypothetical protein [Micromonospora cathayae]|uniref:Uncharacterized protein n=1 Tax=Micromonospora cathayae TaxID=3028804 RepID=A0ABY7ZV84_9ACTN|nr:hypothetical protein [Micromonospora sp. HUAS 3]WDZ86927.1 hypothetical protein PVK37_11265 [Micromonospora sp. HUAS 3]
MTGQSPPDSAGTATAAAGPPDRRITVTVGSHLGDRRPAALRLCRELMEEVGSVAHLARYHTGSCDFALDAAQPHGPAGPLAVTADERQLIGRDVVHVMADLDEQLRPPRTGDLVRLLLHTDRGALFCLSVLREQFLVALAWSSGAVDPLPTRDPAVRAADMELSALANRLRESVSQQPVNYGGWLGPSGTTLTSGVRELRPRSGPPATPEDPVTAGVDPPPRPRAADGRPYRPGAGDPPGTLTATCRRYLDVGDLHYAAVCRAGQIEATADVLDDPRLDRFFDDTTPERRRAFYHLLGQRIDVHLRTLVRAVHLALGSRVRRLVLDVEQGALYCYPVGLDRYLLGVTLDQHLVWAADEKAARLARRLGG